MSPSELISSLKAALGTDVLDGQETPHDPKIRVAPDRLVNIMRKLKSDPNLSFDQLLLISAVDRVAESRFDLVYHLASSVRRHRLAVSVQLPRSSPRVPTVSDVWRTADWHEREEYDLMGIEFEGHPDLSRILLPDDWVGYPLRKDYQFPDEYHGVDCKAWESPTWDWTDNPAETAALAGARRADDPPPVRNLPNPNAPPPEAPHAG